MYVRTNCITNRNFKCICILTQQVVGFYVAVCSFVCSFVCLIFLFVCSFIRLIVCKGFIFVRVRSILISRTLDLLSIVGYLDKPLR